jgi:hypothetical protein
VPLEGVEAKLTILNTPSRMAKQKSAQATAARKRKRAERELAVFCIGVDGLHDGQGHFCSCGMSKLDAFQKKMCEEKLVYYMNH